MKHVYSVEDKRNYTSAYLGRAYDIAQTDD